MMNDKTVRYIEYGKQFIASGASDFVTLSYSDPEIQSFEEFFRDILGYPEQSPFSNQMGAVSAGLLLARGNYLFVQIQRRREGEAVLEKNELPRTNRPFNQIRFTFLLEKDLQHHFRARHNLFTSLLVSDSTDNRLGSHRLQRYHQIRGENTCLISPAPIELTGYKRANPDVYKFAQAITNEVVFSVNPSGSSPSTIVIVAPELKQNDSGEEVEKKLKVLQLMQFWSYPCTGIITFALDHITRQPVQLLLISDANLRPAQPHDRLVYLADLLSKPREFDYAAHVEHLPSTELYDPSLSEFLGAYHISFEERFKLHKISKDRKSYPNKSEAEQLVKKYVATASPGDVNLPKLRTLPIGRKNNESRKNTLMDSIRIYGSITQATDTRPQGGSTNPHPFSIRKLKYLRILVLLIILLAVIWVLLRDINWGISLRNLNSWQSGLRTPFWLTTMIMGTFLGFLIGLFTGLFYRRHRN